MKLISFSEHLYSFGTTLDLPLCGHSVLDAYKPYLFDDRQYQKLIKNGLQPFMEEVSSAWPALKPINAEVDGKGKEVLLYNSVGGMGDNIMMWPFSRILAQRGYRVHILVTPGYESLWIGHSWIQSIITLPAPWVTIQRFHGHAFFEHLTNWYVHKDQEHPLDIMLMKVGLDPQSISDSEKRVVPKFTHWEEEISNRLYKGKRIAFFQMAASQHARSQAPEQSRNLLTALAREFPELHWIGLYGPRTPGIYYEPPLKEPNVEFRLFQKIRVFWSLLRRSEVCVGPDSMLIHAAGTLGVPSVGLWGIHNPESRVQYYLNHFPIFLSEKCARAPCYWASTDMPTFCPDKIPDRTRCGVLQAITEDILIAKVRAALVASSVQHTESTVSVSTPVS